MPRMPEVVKLECQRGPGVSLGGEYMWDGNMIGNIGLTVTISRTEKLSAEEQSEEMKLRLRML